MHIAGHGAPGPDALFGTGYDSAAQAGKLRAWLAAEAVAAHHDHATQSHVHSNDITSFCLVREAPVRAVALSLFLEALADNCGADLLRVKGIIHVAEQPDNPAIIHGVQHVFHPPVWMERWPSDDRRTRIVFIGQNIPSSWVRTLLNLLDAEVADETARRVAEALII
jgi:G3E family GTPase